MPRAIEVAAELRKLADALEKGGDAEVQTCWVSFYCHQKESFLKTAKLLPRPLKKTYGVEGDKYARIEVSNGPENLSRVLHYSCSAPRSVVCRVIEPARDAVYDCELLLSEAEEAVLTT